MDNSIFSLLCFSLLCSGLPSLAPICLEYHPQLWGKGSSQLWFSAYCFSPWPVKFRQWVLWLRQTTLVWRQSQSCGKRFPRVREMASSATTPYITKLKMERSSVSVLVAKLENPQTPKSCCGYTCCRGWCPIISHESLSLFDNLSDNEAKNTYLLSFLESNESEMTVPKNQKECLWSGCEQAGLLGASQSLMQTL